LGLLLEPDVEVELFSTHSLLDELSRVEIYFWDEQILLLSYKSQLQSTKTQNGSYQVIFMPLYFYLGSS
jgi:hypothetical protein